MPTSHDGIMVILSSPSGAGKTTLVNLLSKKNNFEISISHTPLDNLDQMKLLEKIIILYLIKNLKD